MNDLVIRQETRPAATMLTNEQLAYIAKTDFVPKDIRGNLPAILACVATGRAIGIDDMSALRSIHNVDGKATYSAELMTMLVRRKGHSITGAASEDSATATGTRADNGDSISVTWTMKMAERAGLAKKSNWVKYPESMLWARAVSQLCRMLFADCFAGATYTSEEFDDESLGEEEDLSRRGPGATAGDLSSGRGQLPSSSPSDAAEITAEGEPASAAVWDDGLFPPADGVELAVPEEDMPSDEKPRTDAQAKKLNVLVGTLRDAGHIKTDQLYRVVIPNGEEHWPRGEDGELHWSTLRDLLTRSEASDLIERLSRLEEKVKA